MNSPTQDRNPSDATLGLPVIEIRRSQMGTVPGSKDSPKHILARVFRRSRAYRDGDRSPCHHGERLVSYEPHDCTLVVCPEDGTLFARKVA